MNIMELLRTTLILLVVIVCSGMNTQESQELPIHSFPSIKTLDFNKDSLEVKVNHKGDTIFCKYWNGNYTKIIKPSVRLHYENKKTNNGDLVEVPIINIRESILYKGKLFYTLEMNNGDTSFYYNAKIDSLTLNDKYIEIKDYYEGALKEHRKGIAIRPDSVYHEIYNFKNELIAKSIGNGWTSSNHKRYENLDSNVISVRITGFNKSIDFLFDIKASKVHPKRLGISLDDIGFVEEIFENGNLVDQKIDMAAVKTKGKKRKLESMILTSEYFLCLKKELIKQIESEFIRKEYLREK